MIPRRGVPHARVVVPGHRQIRAGTLCRITADAGLTVEDVLRLLGR
jgi:predicted RNA binding protein YcfA (HicA-like mRNA interferase family)